MIRKLNIVDFSTEINPTKYMFVSSYLHWKFQFKNRKFVELKKSNIFSFKKLIHF